MQNSNPNVQQFAFVLSNKIKEDYERKKRREKILQELTIKDYLHIFVKWFYAEGIDGLGEGRMM